MLTALLLLAVHQPERSAEDRVVHEFADQRLTDVYYAEGVGTGDIDGDGHADVVYGPHWYRGPEFAEAHEIYPPKPQNTLGYADNFFNWVRDFDGDGDGDLFVVGFPGTPAYVYENVGAAGHWPRHEVAIDVGNEAPQFADLTGDGRPELVCLREGAYGYAEPSWDGNWGPWNWTAISGPDMGGKFTHGLGVGDVNGDGRMDLIHARGWLEQPESADARWIPHSVEFTDAGGGADMHAYDVDGDGDNDVVTSEQAHRYGVSWYEQTEPGRFARRRIVGEHPADSRYGLVFTEPHSVALADIDGDGLKDIVTGKTFRSHHDREPQWDAGAVVYWFKLVRGADTETGVDWVPHLAAADTGIGRQLNVADVTGDGLPDLIVGGMKGAHVLTQSRRTVDEQTYRASLPEPYAGPAKPRRQPQATAVADAVRPRGPRLPLDGPDGKVRGATEGEALVAAKASAVTGGRVRNQPMGGFPADEWSGGDHLWWTGGKPGDTLTLTLPEQPAAGTGTLELAFTLAPDYATVQAALNGTPLGKPLDLYDPVVSNTGPLRFPDVTMKPGTNELTLKIVGANPKARKAYMVGLDYLRFGEAGDGDAVAAEGGPPNADFETGATDGWTAAGDAFADQPVQGDTVFPRRNDMRSRHRGDWWIGGYEKHRDDARTGTLTSEPFAAAAYASFLVGGGESERTRVEIVRADTGDVVFSASGQRNETLRRVVADLREHEGQQVFVRLLDRDSGPWGHLNFDHFRLHREPPAPVAAEKTRIEDNYPYAGLPAAAAAAAMKLPEGFRVLVGAAEPDVKQPIALALDHRGRVWIAEAYEYPRRAEGMTGKDRILVFEDTDGDGSLDERKVFAEGLNLVSGLEVGFGGVWVGAAPYLLFIPDADGDDVPDGKPEILLDGWGYEDTHETLNAFIWGPDGWLYGCQGVFTHSRVGKPGTADDQRTPLNAGVWRYHPTRHEFEVFAHGTSNPWGVDFDDHGQAFITACVIPHLYHVIPGGRYQRQAGQHFNPHTYDDLKTIADHSHFVGNIRDHAAWGQEKPDSYGDTDAAGGGHAHAGAMIYLGGAWPDEYRGKLIFNNIHGQRLNLDSLVPEGSGYVGTHEPDFLLTGDQFSQILNLRYGPDGQAWMIDWYDMQSCHRTDPTKHDRSNGRIYKIVHGEPDGKPVDLTSMSTLELAKLVMHPNDWYVRHGRRLLQERVAAGQVTDAEIVQATNLLGGLANIPDDQTRRLRALWALNAITGDAGLDPVFVCFALDSRGPQGRAWMIRLLTEQGQSWPQDLLAKFEEMARTDPSPVVRLELAAAAQRTTADQRWDLLAALASHSEDAGDHNIPLMVWYAAEPLAEADPKRALAWGFEAGKTMPLLRDFMLRRIAGGDGDKSLALLVEGLGDAADDTTRGIYLDAMTQALAGRRNVAPPQGWSVAAAKLYRSGDRDIALSALAVGASFGDADAIAAWRDLLTSDEVDATLRRRAAETLVEVRADGLAPALHGLIGSPLTDTALRGLARYDHPETPSVLLKAYPKLDPTQKRLALATLCARPSYAEALLQAIASGRIPTGDLTADLVRQVQNLGDETLAARLGEVWGTIRQSPAEKREQIEAFTSLLAGEYAADLPLGREVFSRTCGTCHQLYGVGRHVGPDLTGSNRGNLDYLLSNIIDPSAVMAKEYQPTVLATEDGRVVTGVVVREDANTVTLRTADEEIVVPTDEVAARKLSPTSMMPDGQLEKMPQTDVRALVAYLRHNQQVPKLATPRNAGTLFDGKTLAGWTGDPELWSVDGGEIVGRTATGLKTNAWLVSDLTAGDFELSLQIKLTPDSGNSGIQIRSKFEHGTAVGYQVDAGAGWWGKLYEEHGRGLLWDKSGEKHAKEGDWNDYRIVARGHRIRTFLNGHPCVDLDDPEGALRGIFALQIHSGGPMEVRFRNLKLTVLEADDAAAGRPSP